MGDLAVLLGVRFRASLNRMWRAGPGRRKRIIVMGVLGAAFLFGLFLVSCRVLRYFQSVELIGDLLAHQLLGMILLTFFSLLLFSHVISALSNLYLSRDLEFCHATPVSLEGLFLSRFSLTLADSSWMPLIFGIPVFLAYGFVYRPPLIFYWSLVHLNVAMAMIAGGLGVLITMVLVYVFPARRTRDIVMLMVLFMVGVLYVLFRMLRPERMVDPDAFFTIAHYVSSLRGPEWEFLPTHWATEVLWSQLTGGSGGRRALYTALSWTTAGVMVVINVWAAGALYFEGFSKSQEAKRKRLGGRARPGRVQKGLGRLLGRDMAACMVKELRCFLRDNTQWTQLLLLAALVVVYVFNFEALPLDKSPIRLDFLLNELAFLNLALAGFVLSAVSARFVFPSVSSEGRAYWIVRSSPMGLSRFVLGKYLTFLAPMMVLGEILTLLTDWLLEVSPFMMALSGVTMLFMVCGIVALGIGMGAMYPKFDHENIAQVATGFGGVMFMIVSALFIGLVIVLEAGPVYLLFRAQAGGIRLGPGLRLFIAASLAAVVLVNGAAVYYPLKKGIGALRNHE
ncbi:MAG: hypothetical protein JRJ35_16665 [Deltaproteobacteria bacterium]|nr:hypothetical protein [Deltaproteobacteria bacterium]MBW1950419.1 hypothetical protein [Deltaproteobacteria bacterium]MBW2009617.1 hypothetical protein [Deltaproteobacteria bacterium]